MLSTMDGGVSGSFLSLLAIYSLLSSKRHSVKEVNKTKGTDFTDEYKEQLETNVLCTHCSMKTWSQQTQGVIQLAHNT